MEGTGPRDHSTGYREPQTPVGRRPPSQGPSRARPRVVLGFSGRPPRPRSDSASQFPTGGGSAPRRPMPASPPVPRAARALRPRRPAYRARSPSHYLQRVPAASLSPGTLPASRALAGGHVTDGRRARVRVRTPAGPAWASAAYPAARAGAAAGFQFSVAGGGETGGCLESDLVHTLCLSLPHSKREAREPCAVSSFGFLELQIPPRPRQPTTGYGVR